jgi:two-component system response regulator MprA
MITMIEPTETAKSAHEHPGPVLLVEDDPSSRRVMVRLLRRWGYDVIEAPDGLAALDRFHDTQRRFGAVVLDIMLPFLNGVDVARSILAEDPALPIVACSAVLNQNFRAELSDLGIRNFVDKPFDAEQLQAALRAVTRNEDE